MAAVIEYGRRSKKQAKQEVDTEDFRIMVRLPPEMANQIRREAEEDFRPMNAQILKMLDFYLRQKAKS